MKRQFKLLPLLTLTILCTLTVANKLFFSSVNATYVEGHISQDTTWTLADSPYVVTKDLIVDPGVTLTISPGVEVRFGGNFILAVEGRLSAIGTQDRMITFTSNKFQPQAGDWNTVKFNGTQQSTVAYSIVKYAVNGITIENSTVEIKNCRISDNSQNGIYITGAVQTAIKDNVIRSNQNGILLKYSTSGVNITDNEVFSNTQNGVYLHACAYAEAKKDSDNVTATTRIHDILISENNVSSNGNGIFLHSYSIANASYFWYVEAQANASMYDVTVSNNIIKSNTDNGMRVYSYAGNVFDAWYSGQRTQWAEARAYVNAIIFGNILSANQKGIYESGQTGISPSYANPLHSVVLAYESANITRNSVSYNVCGVLFERATDNVADYNDIYGNTYGMNLSLGAAVKAEYNYWGDPSGPYHLSLNPSGKGNPVNGDGIDLDFIPFLTAPSGYVNERPIARLVTDKTTVALNQPVTFDGSTSSDDRRVDKYFFNFGDEKDSGWTTLSVFVHNYSLTGVYEASLIVMDDFGVTSSNTATKTITAQQLSPLNVSLTLSRFSIGSGGQVSLTVHVANQTIAVENASVKLVSNKGGTFTPESGYTNPTGDFSTTFAAPSVTEQTNVRITATASKTGYADGSDYEDLEVLPPGAPTLTVQITLSSSFIKPLVTSNVTVHVTSNANPVPDATVRVSSSGGGSFTPETGNTDSNGNFKCTFTTPQTTTQVNITITATATKSGYLDGIGQREIIVSPEGSGNGPGTSGLPIATILMMLVPIVVVIVIAVLIIRNRRRTHPAPHSPAPHPAPTRPVPSPR